MRTQLLWTTTFSLLAMCTAARAFSPDQRLAFVTSVQGNGNLSSWVDAGGNSGLAAADAICVNRAKAALLPEPEQFVAWMSDSNNDAYCRIHGLPGKLSAKCGQATLPNAAGPWWRTDGLAFADNIGTALDPLNRVLRILNIDEFGQPAALFDQFELPVAVFTGTDRFGQTTTNSCKNWTSSLSSDSADSGLLSATAIGWTTAPIKMCHIQTPIYCLQKGTGSALVVGKHHGRPAFVTNDTYSGNFASSPRSNGKIGVEAADAICQFEAKYFGKLPRSETFRAWISAPGMAAKNRFAESGPWYRIDGVKTAASLSQLIANGPEQPLNVRENAGAPYTGQPVWTGTDAYGNVAAETCSGWTSDSGFGRTGAASSARSRFSDDGAAPKSCISKQLLYCLADNDTLFAEDFEPPQD